eukprot:1160911-Pelagomonas_calceolata.AAC.3
MIASRACAACPTHRSEPEGDINAHKTAWEHLEHVERMVQLRGKQGPEAQPDGKDLPVLQLPVTIPFLKLKIGKKREGKGMRTGNEEREDELEDGPRGLLKN